MPNYSTIEEKAVEWNISARHIQYLCRIGKINNAIKRAGAWSIPDDAPNPAKNSKSSGGGYVFVGTKNKIFSCAIDLFLTKGFESVTLKDISNHVGIRQTTVYSHFKSKHEILDAIYGFYCHYYAKERLSLQDMEPVLRKESLSVILGCIQYESKGAHQQTMLDISKLIFQRMGADARAKEIAGALLNDGISYIEAVFNLGIEIGRFAPFDAHAIAVFVNSVRIYRFCGWLFDFAQGDMKLFGEDERGVYEYAARFIHDLGPLNKTPVKNASANKTSLDKAAMEKTVMEKAVLDKAAMEKAVMEKAVLNRAASNKAYLKKCMLQMTI